MADLIDIRIPESDPGGIAIIELITDIGIITIAAEIYFDGDILVADKLHIEGLWAGALGLHGLYRIACQVLRRLVGVDAIRIHGARRTTGKGAGKVPRTIFVTRSRCRAQRLA
jgi:hypothetical protein